MAGKEGAAGPLARAALYMVEVRARDFARMCRFYGGTLGLPEAMLDKEHAFAMYGKGAPYVAVVGKEFSLGRGRARVVPDLVVEDLDEALSRLRKRRVHVLSPPEASHEGYRIARIADPEGNEVHLFEWTRPRA